MENGGTNGLQAFSEVRRAIVVTAHADDLETLMAGTIWRLRQQGVEFYELILTRGDLGTQDPNADGDVLSAARLVEARAGAAVLGLSEVAILDNHDGELEASLQVRAAVAGFYRKWQPDTLFTFDPSWPGQMHPDHRAAGRAALDAFMPSKMPLYHPEQLDCTKVANIQRVYVFGAGEPTVFVDVADVYQKKVEASLAHRSQFPKGEESLNWMRELDSAAAERAGLAGRLAEQFGIIHV